MSIETAEKETEIGIECSVLNVCFSFDVGRSSFKATLYGINVICEFLQNNLVLMRVPG